jgi:hypothetical protein
VSNTQSLPLVLVEIDRGKEKLTVDVPQHEIRVLQAVHGEENVRHHAKQEDVPDEGEFALSAGAEYDRLKRKYNRINAPDFVRMAYPAGPEALVKFGFEDGEGGAQAAPQSLSVKNKKSKPEGEAEQPADPKASESKAAKAK